MSSYQSPGSREIQIEELKTKLDEFVDQTGITNFEGDDIVELIEEGESIEWIVNQLKSNRPNIEIEVITGLLTEIKGLIGPAETFEYREPDPERGTGSSEAVDETGVADLSQMDLSQLDLSQLVDALPADVELPPGVDVNQLKNLMESPQGKIMSDFLLFCREKGVDLNEGSLSDPKTQKLQEEWTLTPRDAFDGKTPGEMMEDGPGLMPTKIETYRREEPRVGRNDPCPCGSGKKYKKCCGKN